MIVFKYSHISILIFWSNFVGIISSHKVKSHKLTPKIGPMIIKGQNGTLIEQCVYQFPSSNVQKQRNGSNFFEVIQIEDKDNVEANQKIILAIKPTIWPFQDVVLNLTKRYQNMSGIIVVVEPRNVADLVIEESLKPNQLILVGMISKRKKFSDIVEVRIISPHASNKFPYGCILIWFIAVLSVVSGSYVGGLEISLIKYMKTNRNLFNESDKQILFRALDLISVPQEENDKAKDLNIKNCDAPEIKVIEINNSEQSTPNTTLLINSPVDQPVAIAKTAPNTEKIIVEVDEHPDHKIKFNYIFIIAYLIFLIGVTFIFYLLRAYVIYFLFGVFLIASTTSLTLKLEPFMTKLTNFMQFKESEEVRKVSSFTLVIKHKSFPIYICIIISALVVAFWFFTRKEKYGWILLDFLGYVVTVNFVRVLIIDEIPLSFRFTSCALIFFFFWDIFLVFITPFFTSSGQSILVDILLGGEEAKEVPKEVPPLVFAVPLFTFEEIPYKRCYPDRFFYLGFGDIVVPGVHMAFCHAFDIMSGLTHKPYFSSSCIGYGIGLIVTHYILLSFQSAQPALLYLVPGVLIPSLIVAVIRKEFSRFWNGIPLKCFCCDFCKACNCKKLPCLNHNKHQICNMKDKVDPVGHFSRIRIPRLT